MSLECDLVIVSATAAAVYGGLLAGRPPSPVRNLMGAAAVGGLAGLAYVAGAQLQLSLALGLGMLGDGLLAGEPRRWSTAGLAALLAGLACYVWLFLEDGGGRAALLAEPWRNLGVAGAMAAGAAMLLGLWRGGGQSKFAAAALAVLQTAVTACAFTLPHQLWPAMVGAPGLMASSALLAGERLGLRSWWSPYLRWWLYFASQAMIAWAYLR